MNDNEQKRQLDLRLASGEISIEEYDQLIEAAPSCDQQQQENPEQSSESPVGIGKSAGRPKSEPRGPRVSSPSVAVKGIGALQGTIITCFIIAGVLASLLFFGNFPKKWEYQVVDFGATAGESSSAVRDRTGSGAVAYSSVTPSTNALDIMGAEGWELVSSYLETETAWPNFGNDKYVAGLQPNVRPQRLVLIFKRPLSRFNDL